MRITSGLKKVVFLLGGVMLLFVTALAHTSDYDGKRIGDIGISGNYPYIDNRIRKYLTIRPGDVLEQGIIDDQAKRIGDFYEREGWIGTEVGARAEYQPDYDSVIIHFKIKRGFLLRYKNINVAGNYSLPTSMVASKINTWVPYKPRRLREATHRITGVYRKKGHPLARVKVVDKKVDLENHTIDVTIQIDEGPFVDVNFTGNEHLGGRSLKKVITIYKEGAIDSFELEESIKAIRNRYKKRGFPNAYVSYSRKEISKDKIVILFNIDEGKSLRVQKIAFEGNEGIRKGKLKDQIRTKSLSFTKKGIFDDKVLNYDLKLLGKYYRSKGYLDAVAETPRIETVEDGTRMIITIPIEEGKQFFISSINFVGDTKFPENKLLKPLKFRIGKPLNENVLDEERELLVSWYADNGYPYADIKLDVLRDNAERKAALNFTINTGEEARFGTISISGDFLTSQKAIRKALGIKEGDPFSYAKLVNAKASLRRLGTFASADVEPIGLNDKATIIPIEVKVEELRPFKLDLDLGYSTDQNFIGTLDFVNRNSFGWAKRTSLLLSGGKKYSRAELGWMDPKFAGYDLEMTLNGWLQYENTNVFKYIETGGGVGLFRRYHRTSYLLRTELNRNYFVEGSSTAADAASLRNNTISETSLSMSFDTRNNFADPAKGTFAMGYTNFFNEIKGRNAHFVKFGVKGGVYATFWDRITLANDARFENIQTFGKDVSVPSNQLLLLGGDDTIRGFDEHSLGPVNAVGAPTGGRLRFILNDELRFRLFDHFQWIIFHDMGFLTNYYSAVSVANLRHGVGLGIHYITPIGPIKLDYGFIVKPKNGEHMGRFHLTFGYVF